MSFKVGDRVMHTPLGLGQISAIERKEFAEGGVKLYYVVVIDRNTVWVPVLAGEHPSLRSAATKSSLEQGRRLLRSRPAPLTINRRLRSLDFSDRLQQRTFESLCEIVRDLHAHALKKPLGNIDSALLRNSRESICREWAAAAGISESAASAEIADLLKESLQAHKAS